MEQQKNQKKLGAIALNGMVVSVNEIFLMERLQVLLKMYQRDYKSYEKLHLHWECQTHLVLIGL